jgi:hypothetical protein
MEASTTPVGVPEESTVRISMTMLLVLVVSIPAFRIGT